MVAQIGGASVGRRVARAPEAPHEPRQRRQVAAGDSVLDEGRREPVDADQGDPPPRGDLVDGDGLHWGGWRWGRPHRERDHQGGRRGHHGEGRRERADAPWKEQRVHRDREEDQEGDGRDGRRSGQGPQRVDRDRVAVAEQVEGIDRGGSSRLDQQERAQPRPARKKRRRPRPEAEQRRDEGQQKEHRRAQEQVGQEKAEEQGPGLTTKPQVGIQVEREDDQVRRQEGRGDGRGSEGTAEHRGSLLDRRRVRRPRAGS